MMATKFWDEEDIPLGKRFCTTCQRFFNSDNLVYVSEHRGVTFYLDSATGAAHSLLSEKISSIRKQKLFPTKGSVETIVHTPALPPPVATPDPLNLPSPPSPANQAKGEHIEPSPPTAQPDVPLVVMKGNDDVGEQPAPSESETPDNWAMWEPQNSDWFEGRVKTIDNGYMFLTLTNGDDVFVPYDLVNFPNSHRCVIQPHDVVSVRIEPSIKGTSQWTALEVFFQTQHEVPPEPENGTILWWTDRIGVVVRECGCRMFVRAANSQPFDVGDPVSISEYEDSLDPNRPGKVARQIEFAGEQE
jgi:hypothetical protein